MKSKLWSVLIGLCIVGIDFSGATSNQPDANRAPNRFFEFHSGFWINLHHFLYLQAVLATPGARKDGALAVERAVPVHQLTGEQQIAWDKALAYYRSFGSSDALFDPVLIKANYELSDAANDSSLDGRNLPREMATALTEAAPVYRALWWSDQDQQNRHWIELASRLVAEYGDPLAHRIASVYRTKWPPEKIPVEVVPYANWAGAYTTLNSTLITVSSLPPVQQPDAPLETVFHEASHAFIGNVQQAISEECNKQGVVLTPPTLWHAVLFYTTGEFVKELIPGYMPLAEANGLWTRAWPRYIDPLQRDWKPYLDGKVSFESAITALVKDSGQPVQSENRKQ